MRYRHKPLPNRKAPGIEPYDFVPFFRALAAAGYDGRVSVEGGLPPAEGRVATPPRPG